MKRPRSIFLAGLLAAPSAAAFYSAPCLAPPAWAQQSSPTPLAVVPSPEARRYPDGSRLDGEYEHPNQPLAIPPTGDVSRPSVMGLAAAASVQANLPEGFTVLPAATKRTGSESPVNAAIAPGEAAGEKFVTVHPIAYQGVPLAKGSDYTTMVSADGRLLVTRKRGLPNSVNGTTPTVGADEALAAARKAGGSALSSGDVRQTTPALEVWVDDQRAGHLAWTFTLSGGSAVEPDSRRFWIAALGEPRVLHWESEIYHAQQHGLVTATIWTASSASGAPMASRAVPDLQVTRSTDNGHVITGPDGRYAYAAPSGDAQISAQLQGPFAAVQNQAGPGLQVAQSGGPDAQINLNFGASSEADLAQTSAFYWTSFAHELARPALGPTALANLPVRTNINAACNAFWDGRSLNFFRSGGGCPNTAYSDVVLHEFGHGVDAANGGIVDGGYSEGFGDALAVLGTRQSCLGRDFRGPGTCLRPATDMVLWPPPAGDDVHDIGRRYAGFVWELVRQLRQSEADAEAFQLATRLVLGAAMANPSNIPDAVRLSFIVDAPDGNPAHGSPHFRALAAAADSRRIPRPAEPVAAGAAASSSASFPWAPPKTVNTNSVILQTTIHLDRPAAIHITANSSAMSATGLPFQTGFFNDPNPGVVWTSSYRNLTAQANQWSSFGSTASVNLPAGDQTIYWKIWVNGGALTLSSGSLLVQGYEGVGSSVTVASAGDLAQTMAPGAGMTAVAPTSLPDVSGQGVTRIGGQ